MLHAAIAVALISPGRRAVFRPARKLTGLHFICCRSDSGPQGLHLRDVLVQLPDLSQEPLNDITASQPWL
jgi:hypothetical protein